MNQEKSKKLFVRFSFFHPEQSVNNSLMSFGFECDDGWFQLLWNLCEEVEKQLEKELDPKDVTKALLNNDHGFEVLQVKEKFGGLRFYTNAASPEIYTLIDKAENKSYKICETCGHEGENIQISGWYKVICKECKKKVDEKMPQQEE